MDNKLECSLVTVRLYFSGLCTDMSTGSVVGDVLNEVVPILRANLQPNKDAELRSKFFTLLSRLIVDVDTTDNTDQRSAVQQLHWLPIHYRIQCKLCLLMYSVCQQQCPVSISNMLQSVANYIYCQGLRSSTRPTFVVPRTRTKLRQRAFSVCGPVAWNALPATIHNTTDSKLFRRLLKSHFYNRSFDITA